MVRPTPRVPGGDTPKTSLPGAQMMRKVSVSAAAGVAALLGSGSMPDAMAVPYANAPALERPALQQPQLPVSTSLLAETAVGELSKEEQAIVNQLKLQLQKEAAEEKRLTALAERKAEEYRRAEQRAVVEAEKRQAAEEKRLNQLAERKAQEMRKAEAKATADELAATKAASKRAAAKPALQQRAEKTGVENSGSTSTPPPSLSCPPPCPHPTRQPATPYPRTRHPYP